MSELCGTDDVATVVGSVTTPVDCDCGGALGDEGIIDQLEWLL